MKISWILKYPSYISFTRKILRKQKILACSCSGGYEFTANIDTIILGRKTYDYVLKEIGSSHYDNGQRDVYVITRTQKPSVGRTTFYTGNLTELVKRLKSEDGKNIYCDGGAEIINELLKNDLIDEFVISIVPILVGNGTRLFKDGRPEQQLELLNTKAFDTGLTQRPAA